MSDEEEAKPGPLLPLAWAAAAIFVTLVAAVGVGVMASGSESAGVSASQLAAGPTGFVCSGAVAALVVHFASRSAGVRIGVPIGCGCLGGIGAFVMLVVFYAAIWPSL